MANTAIDHILRETQIAQTRHATRRAIDARDTRKTQIAMLDRGLARGWITQAERDAAVARIDAGESAFEPVAAAEIDPARQMHSGASYAALADPERDEVAL